MSPTHRHALWQLLQRSHQVSLPPLPYCHTAISVLPQSVLSLKSKDLRKGQWYIKKAELNISYLYLASETLGLDENLQETTKCKPLKINNQTYEHGAKSGQMSLKTNTGAQAKQPPDRLHLKMRFFNCLVGRLSMIVWTPAVWVSYIHVFCICTCSAQLSMERLS